METVLLKSQSKKDMKLLIELATKIGMFTKVLTPSEIEDWGLVNAMKLGKTEQYIDNKKYLKKLRDR